MSSDRPLADRVALVTGAGKGLGRAFALHLAELGANVVVNNRNRLPDVDGRGPADHVVAEIVAAGGRAVPEHSDVTDPGAADRMVALALDTFGRLDIIVTSAAVSRPQVFHKTTADNLRVVLEINVVGTALVAAAALNVMREAGQGRIVLVGSTAGVHGEPTASAYAASKGAILALGRTMAAEGARRGVLTNVLLPYAMTAMTEAGMDPRLAELMSAQAVAPVVGALVDPTSTLNGQVVVAGGGGVRVADAVEFETVTLPGGPLSGAALATLLDRSRAGRPNSYASAQDAFRSLAADLTAADD